MSHNLGGPPGVYPPPPWANSNTNNDNSNRNVGGSEGLDIEVRPEHREDSSWLLGYPNNQSKKTNQDGSIEVVSTPVRPLRYINSQFHLPKENRMRKVFNDECSN